MLAFETPDPAHAVAQEVADAVDSCDGSIIPILAVVSEDVPAYPLALPVRGDGCARRASCRACAPRCGCAPCTPPCCAVSRSLSDAADVPDTVDYDPIEDATVLVAGRGRSYPALTVAIGERMGLIGALSIETARSYLGARDIDGVVIGDGFNRSVVEDFMEELGADPRWRDLPVIVPRERARSRSRAHAECRRRSAATRRRSPRTSSRSRACMPSRRG